MATKTYSHSWSLSGTYGMEQPTTITSSAIATFVANNIPAYSTINSVKVKIKNVYQKIAIGSTNGDWCIYVQNSSGTIGNNVYKSAESITKSSQTLTSSDIKSYFKSGTSDAGALNGYAGIRVTLEAQVTRPWYVNGVDIIWDYTPKTYTATFKNHDGTVLQTVTVNHGSTPSYTGSTPIRTGYTFNGWKDANGNAPTAITGNVTYTAQWIEHTITFNYYANNGETSPFVTWNAKPSQSWPDNHWNYSDQKYAKTKVGYHPTPHSSSGSNGTYGTTTTGGILVGEDEIFSSWEALRNKYNVSETAQSTTFNIYAQWTANSYTIKFNANGGSGSMSNLSMTYDTAKSLTANSFTRSGYRFKGWSTSSSATSATYSDKASVKNLTSTNGGTVTLYAVWERSTYTVTFRNADGSVVLTKTVDDGTTLGTAFGDLPSVSRNGYTFGGWIPCAPANKIDEVKSDGSLVTSVLDSYQYTGSNSYPLDTKYKYTDKFSVHIEAYMLDWNDIVNRQIISCTEGGGWGLGYQANNVGRGFEIRNGSGYKGIDLGFGTSGKFSNDEWYAFDIVFSNSTAEVYVDEISKGTTTISDTAVSYYGANTIFVGAEAGKNNTTAAGNYFKGFISNVFIANQGTRLVKATETTVVDGNIDYYPVWKLNTTCTATFKNHDGTVLQTVTVDKGGTPSYTKNEPTRASTAEYSYTFSGWNPSVGSITSDTVYTAQFTATKRSYAITVSAGAGGTVSGGGTYEYGKSVDISATPNIGYKFVKWSDGNTNASRSITVTGATTYTATFEKIKYTITASGSGGTVTGGGVYEHGSTVTLVATPNTGYKFVKWSDDVTSSTRSFTVTSNGTYTAIFERLSYTIIFKNGDGSTLETTTVYYGDTPRCSFTPSKVSTVQYRYTWDTSNPWTPQISPATKNETYTPNFIESVIEYTVTYKDEDGSVLKTESVGYGSKPTPPQSPTKPDTAQWDYTFDGWYDSNGNRLDPETIVTESVIYIARYISVSQKYIVRWFNYDGTILETDEGVAYGTKPVYNGDEPTKPSDQEHSYRFAGWNYDTENGITPSLGTVYIDIMAQFDETDNTYTVKWVNEGVVVETDILVPYGTQPDYDEVTNGIPTKESDERYDYTFIGWSTNVTEPKQDTELDVVTGDITYTAVYSATLKLYSIKVVLFDTELTQVIEYGREIIIEAPNVNGYIFTKWSDGNTDNPRTITVTSDATYVAEYEQSSYYLYINKDKPPIKILVDKNSVIGVLINTHRVW